MNGVNLVLMNLYAPNDISQQVQFFEKVMNKISNYADENIIIGGYLSSHRVGQNRWETCRK